MTTPRTTTRLFKLHFHSKRVKLSFVCCCHVLDTIAHSVGVAVALLLPFLLVVLFVSFLFVSFHSFLSRPILLRFNLFVIIIINDIRRHLPPLPPSKPQYVA